MTAVLPAAGDHLRCLTHLTWDLTVDSAKPGPDHVWFHCHDQNGGDHFLCGEDLVDSAGLLRAAAEHVLTRLGHRAGRAEQEFYLRAARDHDRLHGCPAVQATGRICMFEQHALTELGEM